MLFIMINKNGILCAYCIYNTFFQKSTMHECSKQHVALRKSNLKAMLITATNYIYLLYLLHANWVRSLNMSFISILTAFMST